MWFQKSPNAITDDDKIGFSYLPKDQYYFDSACQTLRPWEVIHAETEYYTTYNACGERVKYKWGMKVDEHVEETRKLVLRYFGKSEKEYQTAFTLNATYGINLVLHQIKSDKFSYIATSDIEHNSVFLPTITWAERNKKERVLLTRNSDGSIDLTQLPKGAGIVVVNTMSNMDGRTLTNFEAMAKHIHAEGGLLLIDAAQSAAHDLTLLKKINFDALFCSGHKMYGPSLGIIVIKQDLLNSLNHFFIGGGTVSDVHDSSFTLIEEPHAAHAKLEPGLQNWAGIIGLRAALQWKVKQRDNTEDLGTTLFQELQKNTRVRLLNETPSSIITFSCEGIDSHQLALMLAEKNIMCRSGYFCCHHYLIHTKKLPPQLRVSFGLHSSQHDLDIFLDSVQSIVTTL